MGELEHLAVLERQGLLNNVWPPKDRMKDIDGKGTGELRANESEFSDRDEDEEEEDQNEKADASLKTEKRNPDIVYSCY